MNEYGILKDAARRKMEGGAGLDTTADFDEYTIYDQGIPGVIPNIPQKKDEKRVRLGASGRPKIRYNCSTNVLFCTSRWASFIIMISGHSLPVYELF